MERHRFDPISAFFGVVFTGAATIVLITDDALFASNTRWGWPVILLVAGMALIASGFSRKREAVTPVDDGMPDDPYAD